MKKLTKAMAPIFCVALLALSLAACKAGKDAVPVTLIADFSGGSEVADLQEIPWECETPLDIEALSTALTTATGLDFFVDGKTSGDTAFIAWLDTGTLISGLDDREQKEGFFFYDAVSLNWFMMDSLAATVKRNLPEIQVIYYSGENGEPVIFQNPEDMASQGLPLLPTDQPYEGSAFFVSHAGGKGEEAEADDLPPNLTYSEEYTLEGDSGDYANAAEAAKLVFDYCKENEHIPTYSDETLYTMVLVDLADIEGEECYVYRLDIDEPTGTIGAAYAYAYQSGGIYMQGYGGQWVPLLRH